MRASFTVLFLSISIFAYSQKFIKYDRSDIFSYKWNIYTVFVDKNDNVYAGAFDQLFRFNGTQWDSLNIAFKLPGSVKAITQDKTDTIRFGVLNNYYYSTLGMIDVNRNHLQLTNTWVNVMITDSEGKIWAGTQGGVSVINGTNVTNYTSANGLKGISVKDIKIASDGTVYICTEAGVSILKDDNWSYLTDADGLVSNNVTAIEIDGNGHLWFGTYNKGISKYDGQNWTLYNDSITSGALLFDEIKDLLWDGSRMWVAGFYLVKFSNNSWTKYTSLDKGPTFPERLAIDSKGNIWISSTTAITMYNKSSENLIPVFETEINTIGMHPNPTRDFIYLSQALDNASIEILDIYGKIVYSSVITDHRINVSGLNKGVYFVSITNKEGKKEITKLIKE